MTSSQTWRLVWVIALGMSACANRGMEAPGSGLPDGGSATGGQPATGGRGGSAGAGGGTAGAGGAAGSATGGRGGATATGGTGTGGGTGGIGGTTTGGVTGQGGMIGTGGTPATGGAAGTGTGGAAGKGGAGGVTSTGGASGAAGGAAGKGGAGGGAYVCPVGGVLNCSSTGALKLAAGQVTDFSSLQWNSATVQWCDADGLRGRLFSFAGPSSAASTVSVDATAENLRLDVMPKDWAGGGLVFESCVNASTYTSIRFNASLASGSLTGCTWQVQLQTQDQRASKDDDPTGGTCASNCYRYPAVLNLALPSASGTAYTEPFTAFNNPAGSAIPTASQVVGIQWQVNASTSSGCTAQLRIDNVRFQ